MGETGQRAVGRYDHADLRPFGAEAKKLAVQADCEAFLMEKCLCVQAELKSQAIETLMTLAELKALVINRVCVRQHEIEMLRRLYAVVSDKATWLLNEAEA